MNAGIGQSRKVVSGVKGLKTGQREVLGTGNLGECMSKSEG